MNVIKALIAERQNLEERKNKELKNKDALKLGSEGFPEPRTGAEVKRALQYGRSLRRGNALGYPKHVPMGDKLAVRQQDKYLHQTLSPSKLFKAYSKREQK